jgi:hypothetical protein
MSRCYYETIICQSSAQALEFYKVAMGFIEITDSTTIPTTVLNRFIKLQQVIPIKFTGWLHELRPTKVETRQDIHHIFRQVLCNMFAVKHNHVLKTVYNLPGFIQRRGSSIYYPADEKEFPSDNISDVVDYEDYDKNLYTNAGKRTTTDNLEKLLFHALEIKFTKAQLMVAPTDIFGIYLAKIFIHQYFSSVNTGVENILKPFFKNNKEMDKEVILDRPSYTKTFDEVRQFLIEIAWNLAKIDTTPEKEKYCDKTCLRLKKLMVLKNVLVYRIKKKRQSS